MKKKMLAALLALAGVANSQPAAQARVLTVDNNPGAVAMFNDFWSAYIAAEPGDALLLAGSPESYVLAGPITKRIHLVGPGYFLAENQIPGVNTWSAKLVGPVVLSYKVMFISDPAAETSAAGSTLTGVEFSGYFDTGVQVTLDRCLGGGISDQVFYGGATQFGRLTVRRCYGGFVNLDAAGSIAVNSIFTSGYFGPGASAANCVFTSGVGGQQGSSIASSIFAFSTPPTAASFAESFQGSASYCMAIGGSFLREESGNINGVETWGDVFAGPLPTEGGRQFDRGYRLKPGSPAIGAGFNGVDMGAFGGTTPYILSGMPSRPRITRLIVPPIANSATGLRFEVSGQSY